jgi:septum site-determining protein MinD
MLAVVGGKGGVGKTVTALGLGAALGRRGGRPLVVDCDADMPDCTRRLSVHAGPGLGAVAAGTPAQIATVQAPSLDGAAVLGVRPGDSVGDGLTSLSTDRPTILDCPGGVGPPAAIPVRLADRVLVVTTPASQAVENAVKSATVARALGTPPAGVVITMGDESLRGLADAVGAPSLGVIPGGGHEPLCNPVVKRAYDRLAGRLRGNV